MPSKDFDSKQLDVLVVVVLKTRLAAFTMLATQRGRINSEKTNQQE